MPSTSKTLEPAIATSPVPTAVADLHSRIVPKSFWLGGLKVDVRLDPTFVEQHNCLGQAIYAQQVIIIDPGAAPLQTTEQAFLHELVHWIFFVMGEHDLRNDERIVDCFAHFLYQALTTAKPLPSPAVGELIPFNADEN
jgi:hypothetical protein